VAAAIEGNTLETRNGRNYHAGQQLHGSDITLVKGVRGGRKNLEDAQRSAEMAKRSSQNGTHTKSMTTGPIDSGTALGIVAQHYLSGSNTFSGNTRISLQADTEVRRSATGTGSTDDLVSLAQGNGGTRGTG
jgi:hypothetical protein